MMAAAKPIIDKIAPLPVPPFLLDDKIYDALLEAPSLDMNVVQPLRAFPPLYECRLLTKFIQHPGPSQENVPAAVNCHKQSLTEGTRPNIQRTLWVLFEVLSKPRLTP